MNFEEALDITQSRLSGEGEGLNELFANAKAWTSELLIGKKQWDQILSRTKTLPIMMGAFPFGFEFPLHETDPVADFGVSVSDGTTTANHFRSRNQSKSNNNLYQAINKMFGAFEQDGRKLQGIVGRKVMFEYDYDPSEGSGEPLPGFFLRPGQKPIIGKCDQLGDALCVAKGLYSVVDWDVNNHEKKKIKQIYNSLHRELRIDSFGIFPSRSRFLRLAIMGFQNSPMMKRYLGSINWGGDSKSLIKIIEKYQQEAGVLRNGINIDLVGDQIGSSIGITAMVKKRFTNNPQYWLDDQGLWDNFIRVLGTEENVIQRKLDQLSSWVATPKIIFGKTGRFVLIRGIHHFKLVVEEGEVKKIKAYVFMVLSALG